MDLLSQPLSVDGAPGAAGATPDEATNLFEKYGVALHAGVAGGRSKRGTQKEILAVAFVKKYIQYAKARPPPQLTKGAADWIIRVYTSFRNDEAKGNQKKVSDLFPGTLHIFDFV